MSFSLYCIIKPLKHEKCWRYQKCNHYLYNRWYTFPSSSSLKLKCHVNLNWGKKIQTETIQFSDIIFTQSDIDAEHNNGCHSQKHFTSALCVHKNTLPLCYVFTNIFYFFAMYSQKIFYFHTMCSQTYFTSTLCVHKNTLLLCYVFTKICGSKIFLWTHSVEVKYFCEYIAKK
jgi:hypothetical protein